uniref:Uncharacterized protein n=1 Tax=Engystomops pustulosus TaxID=76066 RepID=A0AAV6YSI4_ENGPU|nr:hypothetical protein GDO81_019603 [Engystomops pustulosus]
MPVYLNMDGHFEPLYQPRLTFLGDCPSRMIIYQENVCSRVVPPLTYIYVQWVWPPYREHLVSVWVKIVSQTKIKNFTWISRLRLKSVHWFRMLASAEFY